MRRAEFVMAAVMGLFSLYLMYESCDFQFDDGSCRMPIGWEAEKGPGGGAFPFWRVFTIISGEQAMAGHQTFQMPGYWKRFERDEAKPGYLPAHLRILLLTHYLASIQAE